MCKFRDFNKYEVFEDGKIYSYKSKKFLKPKLEKDSYQRVGLYDNEGKRKWYFVHRVIYEAVSGEPIPEGMQVNHINEDKTDNRFFENLNLMTPKENINWGTGIERCAKARINGKHSKAVGAFKDGKLVLSFPSTMEAQRQGFNHGNVSACCRKCFNKPGNNKYKGFEWKYI